MAALQLPSYPNPHDRNTPMANAYAYIGALTISFRDNTSTVVLHVHPNAAAWRDTPLGYIPIQGGEGLANNTHFPTLSEFMGDPEFAQAFGVIAAKIYAQAKNHPQCAGAVDYPPPAS
jgi:hypothetical protein